MTRNQDYVLLLQSTYDEDSGWLARATACYLGLKY